MYENAYRVMVRGKESQSLELDLGRFRFEVVVNGGEADIQILLENLKISDTVVLRHKEKADLRRAANATFVNSKPINDLMMSEFFSSKGSKSQIRTSAPILKKNLDFSDRKPTRKTVKFETRMYDQKDMFPKADLSHAWKENRLTNLIDERNAIV